MEVRELLIALIPLFAFQVIIAIWALVDLSKRKRVKWFPRAVWVGIILLVTLGGILYLAAGRGEE